jgi:hypothetical protein
VVGYVQAAGVPGAVLVMEVVLIVLAFTFTLFVLLSGVIFGIIFPPKESSSPYGSKLTSLQQKREPHQSDSSRGQGSHSSSAGFSDDTGGHKTTSNDKSSGIHTTTSSGTSSKTNEVYLA